MNATPTSTQIAYIEYINQFIETQDNFPSIEVLANHFGVAVNSAFQNVTALRKKGYIEMCKDLKRYRRTNAFKSFMAIRERNAA
tara:strand:- start:835 stop:1086 length:252 start_codon:yes stop_codon:yes gene_type:complete